jgi:hypothetical protein
VRPDSGQARRMGKTRIVLASLCWRRPPVQPPEQGGELPAFVGSEGRQEAALLFVQDPQAGTPDPDHQPMHRMTITQAADDRPGKPHLRPNGGSRAQAPILVTTERDNEAVAWAVQARHEVEAELRKLAAGT